MSENIELQNQKKKRRQVKKKFQQDEYEDVRQEQPEQIDSEVPEQQSQFQQLQPDESQINVTQDQTELGFNTYQQNDEGEYENLEGTVHPAYYLKLNAPLKKLQRFYYQIPTETKQLIVTSTLLIIAFFCFAINIDSECKVSEYANEPDCIELKIADNLKSWVYNIFISSFCIFMVCVLALFYEYPRYHLGLGIGMAIYLQFIHHWSFFDISKISLRQYGAGQSLTLTLFLFIEFGLLFIYKGFRVGLKKYPKVFITTLLVFIVVFSYIIYDLKYNTCKDWNKGVLGKIDETDENVCEIDAPNICLPDYIDGWLDLSKGKTCDQDLSTEEKRKAEIKKVLGEYNLTSSSDQDIKFLAWKSSQEMSHYTRTSEILIMGDLVKNIEKYDTEQEARDAGREIVLDVQNLEFKTKVIRNETLVEERKQMQTEDHLAKNVIVIYIDTVSRKQSHRKLPKSMNFLKKYMNYKSPEYKEDDLDAKAFEFFRYHAIDKKTYNNMFAFQYGTVRQQFEQDFREHKLSSEDGQQIRSIIHELQDAGYIMAHTSNTQSMKSIFRNYEYNGEEAYTYFEDRASDHEMFFFDPNYVIAKNPFGLQRGASSIFRRCNYGHDTNFFPFEYGLDFLEEYRDEKKVLYIELTDGHEITSEAVKYVDDNMEYFLKEVEKRGHIKKDTILYVVSDHGQHMVSSLLGNFVDYIPVQGFVSERMLPMFYLMVTNDVLKKFEGKQQQNSLSVDSNNNYQIAETNQFGNSNANLQMQKNLENNEQRIFGIWNWRNSMLASVYGMEKYSDHDKQNPHFSIFEPLKSKKSCKNIGMHISNQKNELYCMCQPREGW